MKCLESKIRPARVAALLAALNALVAGGQTPAPRQDTVTVVPGPGYAAGSFTRFLFGDHYRDMWTTPLAIPVLSLDGYGGGLRPLARGGSMQTRSLRLLGGDGKQYVFRSVDKDPSPSLPADLRATYASDVARDLISAEHPGGAILVAKLLDAVGVLHATPRLVVMPNDPRLGEFRSDFAGMLGLIEERPTGDGEDGSGVGFAGASRVEGTEKLLERVTEHADESVDAPAFLAARLFDIFVGDWDRHADQWRWARFGDSHNDRWQPIPRDRDWALVNLDGLVWSIARFVYPFPQFVKFDRQFPEMIWLTWNGRLLDRRFLSGLGKPVWDSVVTRMRAQLSDRVIDEAIQQLPPELAAASRGELRTRLILRRDSLAQAADRFYRLLANEVEVHATDESDIVDVVRTGDRFTDVTIRQRTRAGVPRDRTWFHRRFDADETREIRLYLHAGDDRVVLRGDDRGKTLVRVIGGGGTNAFVDSSSAGPSRASYYDTNPRSTSEGLDARKIDRRAFVPPATKRGPLIDPPRDWGSRWRTPPWLGYTPDVGPFVGLGPNYRRYGFRHPVYAYEMSLRAGVAPLSSRWRVEYAVDARRANSPTHASLLARLSSLDIIHFYGFGNESPGGSARAHRVDQKLFAVDPVLHLPVTTHTSFDVGVRARAVSTKLDSSLHGGIAPFGRGTLTRVGLRAGFAFDSRDTASNATRGVALSITGGEYPKLLGNSGQSSGELRSMASAYLGGHGYLRPVLALRIGGDRVWGRYPFYDAAFVGGSATVRGFAEDRFAGNGSLYGNAELRVFLTRFFVLLPGDFGVFGLADAGRVFQKAESSNTFHTGVGGGLWVSFLGRSNTFSLAAARSCEGTQMYFRSGFLY